MIEKAIQIAELIAKKDAIILSSEQLKKIISIIDYTTLNDDDNSESVSKWLASAILQMQEVKSYCGGFCTYAEFSPLIRANRNELPIAIAAVCGNFPSGKALTELKVEEAVLCESMGAEEIDVVINKGWAKENDFIKIEKELALIKGVLEHSHLKVIMETGMLDPDQIAAVSSASIRAGADFIKTSTGKTSQGASLEAVAIMCFVIKEHFEKTGKKIGIKPSGGISTPEEAWKYYELIQTVLGEAWLHNSLFRIGASRLLTNTIDQLKVADARD